MRNIIKTLSEEKSSKERAMIIEKFRDFQHERENKQQILEVYKEGVGILDDGTDKEKIVALRVIGNIHGIFPFPSFGIDDSKTKIKSDEVNSLLSKCMEFLKSDNGNLRIAAANTINHLRSYIYDYEYVNLFYNLLSLKNSEDKKKVKSIKFCLDKIFCPYLEIAIEGFIPNETKRMKINLHEDITEKTKKLAKEVENLANEMVEATERYIKKILALRGKHLFDKNLTPYTENIGMFQVLYEIQKLEELIRKKEINSEVLQKYIQSRLILCLRSNLEKIRELEEKDEWDGVFLNLKSNKLVFLTLDKIYFRFKEIYEKSLQGNFFIEFETGEK